MTFFDLAGSLTGRSVVVTGACGGIGSAITAALATAGVQVLATDRPGTTAESTANVSFVPGDLRELGFHHQLMESAAALAPVAGVVHAAGVIRRAPVEEISEAEFDLQVEVNLKASFFLNRTAWQHLRATGGGSIVNFTSQGWMTGGFQGSVVYSATKGALVSMTRGLARSFAPDNVRVNAVSPGFVDTDMLREGIDPDGRDQLIAAVPLGRLAQPQDLVGATAFLLSDASDYVTGAVLNVSGGQLMY